MALLFFFFFFFFFFCHFVGHMAETHLRILTLLLAASVKQVKSTLIVSGILWYSLIQPAMCDSAYVQFMPPRHF